MAKRTSSAPSSSSPIFTLRRSGGGSERFESFGSGGNGSGRGSVNDVISDGVAASMVDFVFDFMDRSTTPVELLCIGIVPTLRRSGGCSERLESFRSGGNGGDGSVNDVIGDGVVASTTDFVFDFIDRSAALVELLCVGIVPTSEMKLR
ncbi:hypothetical protein VNO80_06495 [Phaseolus coccineus]|uniref:Uncharacterized protein n=1 Tax=Phaseolus coccineus TaxID=3886 RepID=A0AAN9RNX0_PHACN